MRKPVSLVVVVGALLAAACGDGALPSPEVSGALTTVLGRDNHEALRLGRVGAGPDPRLAFSRIRQARISPDGETVAVLDADAPFLRLFDRRGALGAAFVGRGGGPREAEAPLSIAVSDSLVLLLRHRGVAVFDIEGGLLHPTPDFDFLPLQMIHGCGDRWIFYGPSTDSDGRVTWIHVYRLTAEGWGHDFEAVTDRARPSRLVFGRPLLARSPGGVVLYHEHASPSRLIYTRCTGEVRERAVLEAANTSLPAIAEFNQSWEQRSARGEHFTFRPTDPRPRGFAWTDEGLLWLEGLSVVTTPRPRSVEDCEDRTNVYLVTPDTVYAAATAGAYRLMDVPPRAGLIALETTDLVPELIILPVDHVVRVLKAAGSGGQHASAPAGSLCTVPLGCSL